VISRSRPGSEDLEVFLHQARRRTAGDLVLVGGDRLQDRLVDRELQPGGQHHGAQHPHRILEKADVRIADAANQPGVQVFEPAYVVDDRERADVVEECVDGEIAPECVFFGRAVRVVPLDEPIPLPPVDHHQPIVVSRQGLVRGDDLRAVELRQLGFGCARHLDLAPERGDLDRLGAELHVRESEAPPDDPAVPKELLDLVRMGRRPDVEVLRAAVQQQIPDAAPDEVRDVVVLVEPVKDLESVGIDLAT
jgi:hypothetical protein